MKCPHCNTTFNDAEFDGSHAFADLDNQGLGYELQYGECLECSRLIVLLKYGETKEEKSSTGYTYLVINNLKQQEVLFPKYVARKVEPEVPENYKADFLEAHAVLSLSPKASAALSRRLLQTILREEYKIKHASLANEIEEFINLKHLPSYLTEAVDAIRNVGNLAAHPLKDTSTGAVVDVEPGEAEWLLEVIESLFDFTFVQPKRLAERKKKLNDKLKALGKPPMKS